MIDNAGDPPYLTPGFSPYPMIGPTPSPRTMPVNVPFSNFGHTIVWMDREGNVTIKVDQILPGDE